jgi:prophage regulatory protein
MKHSNEEQKQRGEPAGSLPLVGYVRLPTILRVFPVGKSTWWAGVQDGRYPKPVKLGLRISAWRVEDIRALIATPGRGK